jgi:hypothetical protein
MGRQHKVKLPEPKAKKGKKKERVFPDHFRSFLAICQEASLCVTRPARVSFLIELVNSGELDWPGNCKDLRRRLSQTWGIPLKTVVSLEDSARAVAEVPPDKLEQLRAEMLGISVAAVRRLAQDPSVYGRKAAVDSAMKVYAATAEGTKDAPLKELPVPNVLEPVEPDPDAQSLAL